MRKRNSLVQQIQRQRNVNFANRNRAGMARNVSTQRTSTVTLEKTCVPELNQSTPSKEDCVESTPSSIKKSSGSSV